MKSIFFISSEAKIFAGVSKRLREKNKKNKKNKIKNHMTLPI